VAAAPVRHEGHRLSGQREETVTLSLNPHAYLAFFALPLLAACASYDVAQVDRKPVAEYGHRVATDGIALAADPYDDPARAKSTFDEDLRDDGYLPIQLILENRTAGRILLLRERVELIDLAGATYRPVEPAVTAQDFEDDAMAYALLGFGIFSYASAAEANEERERDWASKAIAESLIVETGRAGGGFVYFRLPEEQPLAGSSLRVVVESLDTGETTELQVPY
jgi:hypothetical protein